MFNVNYTEEEKQLREQELQTLWGLKIVVTVLLFNNSARELVLYGTA